MNFRRIAVLAISINLAACGPSEQADQPEGQNAATEDVATHAMRLAQDSIIIDTHIDVPYRLYDSWEDVSVATEGGDFDYPRAVAGGLNAPFMSIYTPAGLEAEGRSKEVADELIDLVNRIVDESSGKFAIALSPADVEAHFKAGQISLPLGMETARRSKAISRTCSTSMTAASVTSRLPMDYPITFPIPLMTITSSMVV